MTSKLLTDQDISDLVAYLDSEDDRTDDRPDVRSKHPRWDQDPWPQHIIQRAMDRIASPGYQIEEVTFQDSKIGLKPHTDNADPPGYRGKTVLFLLASEPVSHTVFFHQRLKHNPPTGAFFIRAPWNPFEYRIPDRQGNLVRVPDLRDLLSQCRTDPESIADFNITPEFIHEIERLIHKRSLPQLDPGDKNKNTGFIQPGYRLSDHTLFSDLDPNAEFDRRFRDLYLSDNNIDDLHGLTVESMLTWQVGSAIVFDREQLHASSNCHTRKKCITLFCHETGERWLDHHRG